MPAGVAFNKTHMSRASLFWVIRGVVVSCPTAAQLRGLREGDLAGLIVAPCKNEPWGLVFMPHPLFFRFVPDILDNTAAALRDMLLACPVPDELMRTTPLFSEGPVAEGGPQRPTRHGRMEKVLRGLLLALMAPDVARRYSWHSFRIGLACALRAAGASDSVILALVRWRSPASLQIYARLSSADSAAWLDAAADQRLASVQAASLPGVAAGALGWEAAVPGVLLPHVYELLGQVETAPGETAEQLLARVAHIPEMDADQLVTDMGRMRFTEPVEDAGDNELFADGDYD